MFSNGYKRREKSVDTKILPSRMKELNKDPLLMLKHIEGNNLKANYVPKHPENEVKTIKGYTVSTRVK